MTTPTADQVLREVLEKTQGMGGSLTTEYELAQRLADALAEVADNAAARERYETNAKRFAAERDEARAQIQHLKTAVDAQFSELAALRARIERLSQRIEMAVAYAHAQEFVPGATTEVLRILRGEDKC